MACAPGCRCPVPGAEFVRDYFEFEGGWTFGVRLNPTSLKEQALLLLTPQQQHALQVAAIGGFGDLRVTCLGRAGGAGSHTTGNAVDFGAGDGARGRNYARLLQFWSFVATLNGRLPWPDIAPFLVPWSDLRRLRVAIGLPPGAQRHVHLDVGYSRPLVSIETAPTVWRTKSDPGWRTLLDAVASAYQQGYDPDQEAIIAPALDWFALAVAGGMLWIALRAFAPDDRIIYVEGRKK